MSGENRSAADDPMDYDDCISPKYGGCGQRKSIEEFRKGSSICKACEKRAADQDRRMRVVEAESKADFAEMGRDLVKADKEQRLNCPAVEALASKLVGRFGGVDGFVDFWHGQLIAAAEEKPGSKTVLDGCRHVAAVVATANQQQRKSAQHLTDEELADRMANLVMMARKRIVDGQVVQPKIGPKDEDW